MMPSSLHRSQSTLKENSHQIQYTTSSPHTKAILVAIFLTRVINISSLRINILRRVYLPQKKQAEIEGREVVFQHNNLTVLKTV